MIQDLGSGTIPFTIEGGAPDNAFFVLSNGRVGFGTSFPLDDLHVMDSGANVGLTLESTDPFGNSYELRSMSSGFQIWKSTGGVDVRPFRISGNAWDGAFRISFGRIGVGNVENPVATMHARDTTGNARGLIVEDHDFGTGGDAFAHVRSRFGKAQLLVEEIVSFTAPRTLLNLQNNGRPEIVMGNTGTGGEWSFGAGTNFILKQGAVGSPSSAKIKLFEISATGNAELAGQLVTGGPTCSGGCDAVFSDSYDLPSIQEHARAMFALGHLPNVGPTEPGVPVNLSEQYGKLLNELEHAHIYIAQLEAETRRIPKLEARLAAIEAHLGKQ